MIAFEALYRHDPDPWRYRDSPDERARHGDIVRACGSGPFAAALELGGSIGELTALIAPRCRVVETIDASPTAVALARHRLSSTVGCRVHVTQGVIPRDLPRGPFDLVVAADVLHHLSARDLLATLEALRARTRRGARIVAVHRVGSASGCRPLSAALIHRRLRALSWLASIERHDRGAYLIDALERR
ncbi:MAG TPA: class I SAM-dependent methyltransferase [Conexibacter sp.]|jgi:SAM-dependent methyltransferase